MCVHDVGAEIPHDPPNRAPDAGVHPRPLAQKMHGDAGGPQFLAPADIRRIIKAYGRNFEAVLVQSAQQTYSHLRATPAINVRNNSQHPEACSTIHRWIRCRAPGRIEYLEVAIRRFMHAPISIISSGSRRSISEARRPASRAARTKTKWAYGAPN